MADFPNIYVDLSKTTSAPSSVLDDDGAVICDSTTQYGTNTYQLTFAEFQLYLRTRAWRRDITFYFKNSITISSLTDLDMDNNTLFSAYTHSTIKIKNQEYNTSYKIVVDVEVDPGLIIGTQNTFLEIYNMDLEYTKKGYIHFDSSGIIDYPDANSVKLRNCRFWMNEPRDGTFHGINMPDSLVVFHSQREVDVQGCIFNNKSSNTNTSMVLIQPQEYYPTDANFKHIFIGNIFVRVYNFYDRTRSIYEDQFFNSLTYNVFTGGESGFRNTTPHKFLKNFVPIADNLGTYHNEYGWSTVPTICNNSLSTASDSDFSYLSSDWDSIDYTFVEDITGTREYDIIKNIESYGRRDGIGALWFNMMTVPVVSVDPQTLTPGDSVELENSDTNYETNFSPSVYIWTVGRIVKSSTATNGYVSIDVVDYGVLDVNVIVWSHNGYYSVDGVVGSVRSTIESSKINMIIDTYDNDGNATDEILAGDRCRVDITNDVDVVGNGLSDCSVRINGRTYRVDAHANGDQWSEYVTFDKVGIETILCIAETRDGIKHFFYKDINVVANTENTYYVDLSLEYEEDENWLELDHGIYDDFEDQMIDTNFDSQFKGNYTISRMWDEYVAKGDAYARIMNGVADGNYTVEWSFVRTSEDDVPSVIIDMDTTKLELKWNFLTDNIELVYNKTNSSISYGTYINDLYCHESLRKLYIKVEYDSEVGVIRVYYSVDNGETYILPLVLPYYDEFSAMSVSTQCDTGSGLGYIGIQANNIITDSWTGYGNGSEEFPFTYDEMYNRIRNGGTGDKYDRYLCRNSRNIVGGIFGKFEVDSSKEFSIDVWNPHKYGPWMLSFNNFRRHVYFEGTTLSNGIIYNLPSNISSNLTVTNMYDMLVTWNTKSRDCKVGFIRYKTQYSNGAYRSNIVGCTIKSEAGFYTINRRN